MVSPPLFQIHRFTKKSVVLSADFVVANESCDRLALGVLSYEIHGGVLSPSRFLSNFEDSREYNTHMLKNYKAQSNPTVHSKFNLYEGYL